MVDIIIALRFLSFLSLLAYVCIVCGVHMCGICTGACGFTGRPEEDLRDLLCHSLPYAFKSVTEPGPRLMANKAQGSSCFSPLSTGAVGACGHSRLFP